MAEVASRSPMRTEFLGYYRPVSEELDSIWRDSIIVLDTNVLLNLYRYPSDASAELVSILEEFSDRIWIPHHVALEYHRNRAAVISEQKRRFFEVKQICDKTVKSFVNDIEKLRMDRRHATLNAAVVTNDLRNLMNDFSREVDQLEAGHIEVHHDDEIRLKLEGIISTIGKTPDQEWLERVYEEGKERYELRLAPGFADIDKGGDLRYYSHGGLKYDKSFGDLIIWTQMIEMAVELKPNAVLFVTDDDKVDW